MGGGPEFSYEWTGKFDMDDVVMTPDDGPRKVLYGHYVQGKHCYRVAGGNEYWETELKLYRPKRSTKCT